MGEFFILELMKKYIHRNREKGRASGQLTLDDDFNVPDTKPDVIRVIQEKGEVKIEETTVTADHVHVKGVLKFYLLYRSDLEEHKVNSLSGEIPFQESLVMDGVDEYDTANIRWQIEDLTLAIINSRKFSVRALVELFAFVNETTDEEITTDIMCEEECQVLKNEKTFLQLFHGKKDTFRIKEEIVLPSNKPNIHEVLWKNVQMRGVETRIADNQILIKGETLLFVLYLGQEEQERLQWLETAIPFSGVIKCDGCREDMISDISCELAMVELEPKPDYDGEERMLHLEVVLDLDIHIYEEERLQVLEDLYSVNCKLVTEYETAVFDQLLMKNFSKCRVSDRMTIGENQEGILQLCTSEATVSIDESEIVPDGIQVEGTISVRLLYITADDKNPLASIKEVIPFHYTIEVPGITENSRYQLEACLEQLTTIMLDATQVEVKAVVDLNSIVFEKNPVARINQVTEEPLDMKALQEMPGMIGYIVHDGDSLWQIAKENYTTIESIKEMNHLNEERLKEGEKLLIIKKV